MLTPPTIFSLNFCRYPTFFSNQQCLLQTLSKQIILFPLRKKLLPLNYFIHWHRPLLTDSFQTWEFVSFLSILIAEVIYYFWFQHERPQTTARDTTTALQQKLSNRDITEIIPECFIFPRSPGFTREHPEFFITVDATPKVGGAIFRSPKNNIVYFYSSDWSAFYESPSLSQQSDKFEMLNTLIALEVYFKYIHGTHGEKRLIIQTDNNFARTSKSRINSANRGKQLLQTIIYKLEEIGLEYRLRHVTKNNNSDMLIADLLSRGKIAHFEALRESNVKYVDLKTSAYTCMKHLRVNVPSEYVKL